MVTLPCCLCIIVANIKNKQYYINSVGVHSLNVIIVANNSIVTMW